jgi:Flp pilus assembly protein TadG
VVNCNDESTHARRRQAGTSVVEMALVLPLLLLLVFGIGDFGIAYTQWNSLTNAVREGARVGVVFQTPCNPATVTTTIENTVSNFAASSGLNGAGIVTAVTNPCAGTGSQLTVRSTFPYNYIAMAALAGLAPTINLTAQTVMRNE